MTTSADIRGLVISGLKGATDAGQSVFSPFDWPTSPDVFPCVVVRAPRERKRSLGKNAPLFSVTTTVEVFARTRSVALLGDAGSAEALAAAERLKAQIEVALINNNSIWANPDGSQVIEQFESVESEITTSSEGEMPMAELQMRIEIEFTQGPDDFYPIPSVPLEEFNGTVVQPQGTLQPQFSITFQPPIS